LLGISLPLISTVTTSCEQDEGALIVNNPSANNNVLKLDDYPILKEEGGAIKHSFEGENEGYALIIVRQSEDNFLVVSAKCTHMGCIVGAPAKDANIKCGCHGAQFSPQDGSVKAKPNDNSDIPALKKFDYVFKTDLNELEILF